MNKYDTPESLAIRTLYKSGRKSYKPESSPSRGQILGTAIYRVIDYPCDAVELAATICEENNWHDYAKKLRDLANPF